MSETPPKRPMLRRIGAVLAGLLAVVILSTATDMVLRATGVFPPSGGPMTDALFLLATAYRIGGDEFALILPQAFIEGAQIVAERVRARIERIYIPDFGNLTASIGIASFPAHARSRAELFRAADDALYAAKRGGRNRVCVADRAVETLDEALARVPSKQESSPKREEIVM